MSSAAATSPTCSIAARFSPTHAATAPPRPPTPERHLAWTGDAIDIALPATVRYRVGEGSDIVVRGAPDAIAHVEVRGGHLTLNCRWHTSSRDIEVILPGRPLSRLGISGSGRVVMEKLAQPDLRVSISGSGSITGQGAVDNLDLTISGAGKARLGEVAVKNLTVEVSGSGNVEASPSDEADIRISGSGKVHLLFLRRIIPLRLADARFGTWRDRLVYTKHWRTEFEEMELHFKDLAEADFRLYKAMQEWHNRIGDMLAYVNDVLSPAWIR